MINKLITFVAFVFVASFVLGRIDSHTDASGNKVTRCPGDTGSMLWELTTPIGDDCPEVIAAKANKVAHDAKRREEFRRFDAAALCQSSVTSALNDPGSADFDPLHTWRLTESSDTVWTVYPTLRAKNAFGAMIHTGFACQIQLTGDKWALLSLEEL